MRKCLFLDRDGVINYDPGDYTFQIEKFEILPDVLEVVRAFKEQGYLIIVITNQGGVAKGRYSKEEMLKLHRYMQQEFAAHRAALTDVFYSLHHSDISESIDRKPDSLMLEKAIHLYQIDAKTSLMVGDKISDVQAAEKVGIEGIKIKKNQSIRFLLNRLEA